MPSLILAESFQEISSVPDCLKDSIKKRQTHQLFEIGCALFIDMHHYSKKPAKRVNIQYTQKNDLSNAIELMEVFPDLPYNFHQLNSIINIKNHIDLKPKSSSASIIFAEPTELNELVAKLTEIYGIKNPYKFEHNIVDARVFHYSMNSFGLVYGRDEEDTNYVNVFLAYQKGGLKEYLSTFGSEPLGFGPSNLEWRNLLKKKLSLK